MPNRLARSHSPYLLQHAENPVDWHPWGPEAFALARETDRPVLLSVGYSACHWCHVMAHECFEDPGLARAMNEGFVNVKVDREERPDVDAVYMEALQAMTGQGGWPMTLFLTPEGEPFYGGTYFPPAPRAGMPGFGELLAAVAAAWRERRAEVRATAGSLTAALRAAARPPAGPGAGEDLLPRASARLLAAVDPRHGGFGQAPKFPQAANLGFLLGRHLRTGAPEPLAALRSALDAMAGGGLQDQLAGGFHRYCVDAAWTVPHFEKMLYDNAQLLALYLAAWQVGGLPRDREVAERTADYLLAELRGPEGELWASQDADAPGGEGASFLWTPEALREVLGPEEAALAQAYFGVRPGGNFEGATVLSARRPAAVVAAELGLEAPVFEARLKRARAALLAARRRRPQPGTDTKVIAAWNGLAIAALAQAGPALGRPDYLAAATRAGAFARDRLRWEGGPAHSWRAGEASGPAFLDDVAALGLAGLALYAATLDRAWLDWARDLGERLLAEFADPEGGFYRAGPRHEALLVRAMDLVDASTPAGNALAAGLLQRLAALWSEERLAAAAAGALARASAFALEAPLAMGASLAALDDQDAGFLEVAVLGPRERPDTRALLAVLRATYRPRLVLVQAEGPEDPLARELPLLGDRPLVGGAATAYVCRGRVCQAPVTTAEDLGAALARA